LRKRLPARVKNPLVTPDQENVTWSMDFVTDILQSNRKFRALNVIDDSDRVAVAQDFAESPTPRSCPTTSKLVSVATLGLLTFTENPA